MRGRRLSDVSWRGLQLDFEGWETNDLVGAGGYADLGAVEVVDDLAAHAVFDAAYVVVLTEEADGELDPVVGEAHVDARLDVDGFDGEFGFEDLHGGFRDVTDLDVLFGGSVEQNSFGGGAVAAVGDGQVHLFPDEGEVAGVVVDGLVEDVGVGDGDDAAGVLAGLDPHAGVGIRGGGRLPHLHDDGLHEVEGDYISADAAHGDAVADVEGASAQDDEVAGEAGDDFLEREGEAGADEAHPGGEARRIVEPDGDKTEQRKQEGDEADGLAGPEGPSPAGAAADEVGESA